MLGGRVVGTPRCLPVDSARPVRTPAPPGLADFQKAVRRGGWVELVASDGMVC